MAEKPSRAHARAAARLGAVQALYQMELSGRPLADVLAEYGASRIGEDFEAGQCGVADHAFLADIVTGVVRSQRDIDAALGDHLAKGWSLARLDATQRAILRAAAYELTRRDDIPAKVAINEYVEVAKAFFDRQESGFINACLDALARQHRAEEFPTAT